jgi:hypothetical protein
MKPGTLFIAAAICVPLLRAEDQPAPILFIYREEVKPGGMGKLVHIEEEAASFCAKMHCPNPYVAISSFTGPNEIWWINGFDSAETMEKVWRDYAANAEISSYLDTVAGQKADLVFPSRTLLARFREDLSFSSGMTFAYTRFVSIAVVQIRPGGVASFEKVRNSVKGALQRSGRMQWVYQVTSGTEDTTFLVMTPGRTMQELHILAPGEERIANVSELVRDAVASSETRMYVVSPSMSMPAQAWVEADPEFWKRP